MRTPRSWGLLALTAAAVLGPLGATVALAAQPTGSASAPGATFEGDTVPADAPGAFFYNGQAATVSEFPGVVAALRAGGSRPEGQSCTGIVVAPRKILIAAHCHDLQGEKSFVYGLDDLAEYQGGAGPGFYAKAVEYKKHPKYVNFDQGYDVAVVTVDRDIRLKDGAPYPKVATSKDTGLEAPGGSGVGYGYGKKTHNDTPADVTLDKATLPIVDGATQCQGVGAGFKGATMICAGYSDGRVTVLPGDSGGPLVRNNTVIGVASWSRSDFRWYSIYARLNNDMGDWVANEIGSGTPQPGQFGVAVDPTSASVAAGGSVSAAVRTTAGSDGSKAVDLSVSGLPSGVQATFQPARLNTGESSKLTFEAGTSAVNGTYDLTVTGKAADGSTGSARFSLTVTDGGTPQPGDFSLGASPNSVRVAAGNHISTTITSTAGSGGSEQVSLTTSGVPSGVTATLQPTSIATGANAKLTFVASSTAPAGTHTVTVTGTSASGKTATTTVSLTVEGTTPPPSGVTVTLSPTSGTAGPGSIAQTRLTASGGTGTITLSASGAPAARR
ncbi:trypsin-like serine protease [Actinokineospora soli]|uniref:Trypsin-like serine protease n=1 Tax=Actinokineospora soli TaxID=1048753 RepID=A0ABW2TP32_9PSEU